jgi:REP element-mobilizing transposase RayT
MTAPRQFLPGKTYLITRRCSERRFFLRPSIETTTILRYVLAVLAERYGIVLHAYCALSNHVHIVLTDPDARLPDFQRDLGALVARAVNCALGRWEAFWERESYSAVLLETPEAVVEKIVYVLANPIAAGLVRRGSEWPGLWSDPTRTGAPGEALAKPREFFREAGPLPATARLELHAAPGMKDAGLVSGLLDKLRRAEDAAAKRLAEEGRSFAGVARVLAQKWWARPPSAEPRRRLSPRVAVKNTWKRIEALTRLVEFRTAYYEALARWRRGMRDVEFPPGTWLMRVRHLVRCAPA